MKQNTTTENAAAMAATNTPDNLNGNARRFVVSGASAGFADAIIAVSELYDRLTAALAVKYGVFEAEDRRAQPYLKACNEITELLRAELADSIEANLQATANISGDVVQI